VQIRGANIYELVIIQSSRFGISVKTPFSLRESSTIHHHRAIAPHRSRDQWVSGAAHYSSCRATFHAVCAAVTSARGNDLLILIPWLMTRIYIMESKMVQHQTSYKRDEKCVCDICTKCRGYCLLQ
jgi:hypothetical protein